MYGLQAEAHFDGAHFLTDYYGKCENLHGHRWRVVVTIEAEQLQAPESVMPGGADASPYARHGRGGSALPLDQEASCDGAPLREDGTVARPGTMRGMVLDFGVFKRAVKEVADRLDHTFLVEEGSLRPSTVTALQEEGFTLSILPFRTTAENLARWFYDRLAEQGLPVSQVEVDETPNNRAFYAPEGHVGR